MGHHNEFIRQQKDSKYVKLEDTPESVIQQITFEYPRLVQAASTFIQHAPGFRDLPNECFIKLVKRNIIHFYMVTFSHLYIEGESFVFLNNGIHLSRELMSKIRGTEKTVNFFSIYLILKWHAQIKFQNQAEFVTSFFSIKNFRPKLILVKSSF
jgi:hypothetical protein